MPRHITVQTTVQTTVQGPRATLGGRADGAIVAVKAVNVRGLEGWDWARTRVP